MPIVLSEVLAAWGGDAFENVLKLELAEKLAEQKSELPLQAAMSHGSSVTDEPIGISVLGYQHLDNQLQVRIGVFFSSLIAGCSCADDPTPVQPIPEYAEMQVNIHLQSGEAHVCLPTA